MKRRRIILFLDIDGVLLPFPADPKLHIPTGRIFPKETLTALSLILEAFPKKNITTAEDSTMEAILNQDNNGEADTEVDIVLSSTWRVQKYMRTDIISDFHGYAIGPLSKFDDDFHDITDPNLHTERQHEIYEWLQRYHRRNSNANEMLAWVALDDEDLLHGPTNARLKSIFDEHIIHCDSKRGLTSEQAVEAVQLLRRQLEVPP